MDDDFCIPSTSTSTFFTTASTVVLSQNESPSTDSESSPRCCGSCIPSNVLNPDGSCSTANSVSPTVYPESVFEGSIDGSNNDFINGSNDDFINGSNDDYSNPADSAIEEKLKKSSRLPSSVKTFLKQMSPKILTPEIRLLLMMTILSLILFPTLVTSSHHSIKSNEYFTNEEKTIMKRFILQKLGLEDMLQIDKKDFYSHHIPFYIYDFYDQAKDGDIELLRHYMPSSVTPQPSSRQNNGWFIIYNLSATGRIPSKELVVKADLRLKISQEAPSAEEYQRQYVIDDTEEDEPALVTTSWEKFNVYLVDPELREVRRLMDTRFLPEDSLRKGNRWVDFDVTGALTRNRGADVDSDIVEFYVERISADRIPTQIDFRDSAALIVQSETPLSRNSGKQRRKRETNKKSGKQRKQHQSMPHAKDLCRLESLYIDFKDLDWDEWIISPSGYQAYQCRGKCTDIPPSARQNYTNHAVMQSLIHSMNATVVPPPCCVPTEMSSLSILFRDNKNITVVHNYPQMVVDACGCH